MPSDRSADALPTSWQRLLALSGLASVVLLVVGFLISGGDAPDYTATDQEWTQWADSNESKGRIGALLTLLAGFAFLHFAGMIRSVLGGAEATVGGSAQLAQVAFAGGLTGGPVETARDDAVGGPKGDAELRREPAVPTHGRAAEAGLVSVLHRGVKAA